MSEVHRRDVLSRITLAEPLTWPIAALLILIAVVFDLCLAVPPFRSFAIAYLAMDTSAFLARLRLWQAVTSIFVHIDPCHFISNAVFLWFFGSALANAWRPREFLTFFFTCGIVASVCFYVFNLFRTPPMGMAGFVGFGASGAVMGIMIAYAMIFGERIILAFFMIPMKAKYFVAICIAIDLLATCGSVQDGVGHVAHLGGAICGAVYLKVAWRSQRGLAGVTRGKARADSRISGLEVMDDDQG